MEPVQTGSHTLVFRLRLSKSSTAVKRAAEKVAEQLREERAAFHDQLHSSAQRIRPPQQEHLRRKDEVLRADDLALQNPLCHTSSRRVADARENYDQ